INDCFLEKHLTCPICMETFTDPVTTSCGHSFCMRCLELSIASFQVDDACPLCKKHLRKAPKVNNVLRDIVQEVKNTLSQTFTGLQRDIVQAIRRRCLARFALVFYRIKSRTPRRSYKRES
uniref:RING-type domain-containing protein n=1 Tax=Poecilia reticulata TaxID=8081 RepID=A0A3P9Q9F5_POERE